MVAVEAMTNGIPVIASNRGGTPETVGGCGLVLPLPDRLTPMTHILPSAEEAGSSIAGDYSATDPSSPPRLLRSTSSCWSCAAIRACARPRAWVSPPRGRHLPSARERGLAVVALGALCHNNSRSVGLPEAFFQSAEVFARNWSRRLPAATPCVIIDCGEAVHVLGNATAGPRSMAYALVSHRESEKARHRDTVSLSFRSSGPKTKQLDTYTGCR